MENDKSKPYDEKYIKENGVEILDKRGGTPCESAKAYNPKTFICREFVLCTIATFTRLQKLGDKLTCLDAFGGSGLAGLQWKKLVGRKVNVTINDRFSVDKIKTNGSRNGLACKPLPLDFSRTPGLSLPHQGPEEIFISQCSPYVILHMEAFDFVYLDPHGTCSIYLDAAFTNIRNNGIICFVSSDLSALLAKTGHVAVRNYGANVLKTDYMKETAVRVVIGAAARAASRCNKGLNVLFGICMEPFVLVGAQVQRGPYYADVSVSKVRPLLHCQICEERVFYPDHTIPMENLYEMLPCDCHAKNLGKTSIQLGPMWCSSIFSTEFLQSMIIVASELKLSQRTHSLLKSLVQESVCSLIPEVQDSVNSNNSDAASMEDESLTVSSTDTTVTTDVTVVHPKEDHGNHNTNCLVESDDEPPTKKYRPTSCEVVKEISVPPFFYNVHRRKFKGVDLPKLNKMVFFLQSEGFRASRTHFDPYGIRTNASLAQIYQILLKYCPRNS